MIPLFAVPPAGGRSAIGFQTAYAALIMLFCVPRRRFAANNKAAMLSKNRSKHGGICAVCCVFFAARRRQDPIFTVKTRSCKA
ncbi:hypothetical protein BWD09_08300 [Neisseria dentiae]|uniref:Uncharacterized protein n=1 Tax=Neisseria dentiae TaxID=194197 RepID=A0A1X3D7B6_9NEIS|nr:hypothetical protein BWD09_08300 [Neisseria dentiae]